MFDRIINILVIESNEAERSSLLSVIQNPGHNIFTTRNREETLTLLDENKFALIFCSLDIPEIDNYQFLLEVNERNRIKNSAIIVTSNEKEKVYSCIGESVTHVAMDYLIKPFQANLVKSKIGVYKKLFFKHQRVTRLLESILPAQTLAEFSTYGKSSPKKKENCAVLFTDFVNFTKKTKERDPHDIVKKLDFYFSKFDEIILKYKLEKIKTIGDAYMAVGGVTEDVPHPSIRTALAAIEIRNFITNDILTHKAFQQEYWEIRIGIHSGELIAGVVGTHKFSFDVWGDTVNIAARCEQNSKPNKINISDRFYEEINGYFDCTSRGKIAIKNGDKIGMFFLDQIKKEYSLFKEGRTPNVELRNSVGLPLADFEGLRSFILMKLKAELNENLLYHSSEHTEIVEEAVIKYGTLEKLQDHQMFLLKTAALFHDAGFLYRYDNNEELAVELLEYYAPDFGYQLKDIETIKNIILSTSFGVTPKNIMEEVMCDADLDYLGRLDYHVTAALLFEEMALNGKKMNQKEKIETQIDYLENQHEYYTTSAKNLRAPGKKRRIAELKKELLKVRA